MMVGDMAAANWIVVHCAMMAPCSTPSIQHVDDATISMAVNRPTRADARRGVCRRGTRRREPPDLAVPVDTTGDASASKMRLEAATLVSFGVVAAIP
jgi:hypothetical protein